MSRVTFLHETPIKNPLQVLFRQQEEKIHKTTKVEIIITGHLPTTSLFLTSIFVNDAR